MSYVTLSGFRNYASFETTSDDTLLQDILDACDVIINNFTGRKFNASGTTVVNYNKKTDFIGRFDGSTLYFKEDLADELVSTNIVDAKIEYLPIDGPPYNTMVLISGSYPNVNTRLTGYWGYSKTPPAPIQIAELRLAKWIYDQRESSNSQNVIITPEGQVLLPAGLPDDVITILNPYRKVRVI